MLLHLPAKTLFAAIGHLASIVYGYRTFLMTLSSNFMQGRLGQCMAVSCWGGGAVAITALRGVGGAVSMRPMRMWVQRLGHGSVLVENDYQA